jgi:transposase
VIQSPTREGFPIPDADKIPCGPCSNCGEHRRSRHPLQTSDATGAAQSQFAGEAQAAIAYLKKRGGVSHGKIANTFDKRYGIALTPGGPDMVGYPTEPGANAGASA